MANTITIELQLDPAVYNLALVPDNFDVLALLQTNRLRLRPLTIHDAVRDFDAVVTSEEHLRTVYDPGDDWPSGLTLERISLSWAGIRLNFSCVGRLPTRLSAWTKLKCRAVYTSIQR